MGVTAERVAERSAFRARSRTSSRSSRSAPRQRSRLGTFAEEIVPVELDGAADAVDRRRASAPGDDWRRRRAPKPAFQTDGTVTAGNASGINDGAAAVVLMRESEARARAQASLRRCRAVSGIDPEMMGYAPRPRSPRRSRRLA